VTRADGGFWLVVPAAGRGSRLGAPVPKQYLTIAGKSVLEHALAPFLRESRLEGAVLALARDDLHYPSLGLARDARLHTVQGGAERADSVRAALDEVRRRAAGDPWILVHDAVRPCLASEELERVLAMRAQAPDGAVLAVPVVDTLKREGRRGRPLQTVDRQGLWRAQTPQAFRLGLLQTALDAMPTATDEAQAVESLGKRPRLVPGSTLNLKVTVAEDLALARLIIGAGAQGPEGLAMQTRVGSGFDMHAFGPGDHVVLGGQRIAHERGVIAHSDGDVLLHALCDALLGAAGLGDIGEHFPDSDQRYKGISSLQLLAEVMTLVRGRGLSIGNVDLTLLAERPRIGPHRAKICTAIAAALQVDVARVNLKASTTERLGSIGRGEGLAALASVLLRSA
jgi:2-C-methyl-D-erythritol 4-phosphate cytidylyltransferase/2-C-methyl-D-erythritol 2,4-cyclodiphosphate synthase